MDRLLVNFGANCELTWWTHLHGGEDSNGKVGVVGAHCTTAMAAWRKYLSKVSNVPM